MTETKMSATIVADSINLQGDRITSLLVVFPRIVMAEFLTHRMFSRNAASSRAIPFKKMVKDVQDNPFIPIAWQKHHSGMQGTEYWTENDMDSLYVNKIEANKAYWLQAKDEAIVQAETLYANGVTKQLCNRLLEPFQYITVLVTATEWDNFFKLRCPEYVHTVKKLSGTSTQIFNSKKDYEKCYGEQGFSDLDWLKINKSQAEIHIQHIAELIWDARNESTPKQLKAGEWHIPFGDGINGEVSNWKFLPNWNDLWGKDLTDYFIKIATARCARLSYTTLGAEPKIDYAADIRLHDMLLESEHFSPFEHCAEAMNDHEYNTYLSGKLSWDINGGYTPTDKNQYGWCRNFRGFISYRHLISK
jgi:thymidylate synthase ThyX